MVGCPGLAATGSISFAPLADEHLDGAAVLLALVARDDASGVVALLGGEVLGYLVGVPLDERWGPSVWIESAGHAVSAAELVRDLYAAAAARWVDEGRTSHYAMVPATDPELVDAWFRRGLGHQHVHAIREPLAEATSPPGGDRAASAAPRGHRHARPRRAVARGAPDPLARLLTRDAAPGPGD